jgi:inner membrane protein
MQKILFSKLFIISVLAIGLFIPLSWLQDVIQERKVFREEARSSIAQSWSEAQIFTGPVLVMPYVSYVRNSVYDPRTGKTTWKTQRQNGVRYALPDRLAIQSTVQTEERYRGIHKVPVYTTSLTVTGHFKPTSKERWVEDEKIRWKDAYIAVGVTDSRGIQQPVTLLWNSQTKAFRPGVETVLLKQGMHAPVGELHAGKEYPFVLRMNLRGMEHLKFTPLGKETQVTMQSPWPHPSFVGRFLPESRDLGKSGFQAKWLTNDFSTNISALFNKCVAGDCLPLQMMNFGASFYDAVDVYQQTERSLKYDFLFIGLTFIAFFLFEVLKRLPIHPIQYGLVGVALAMFYLLLLALSEHIAFVMAYVTAGTACVLLLGIYLSYVMQSIWRGVGFASMLTLLYGVLYVLIRAEDTSLLLGSAFLFGLLTFVMMLTRKVDWYALGDHVFPIKKAE